MARIYRIGEVKQTGAEVGGPRFSQSQCRLHIANSPGQSREEGGSAEKVNFSVVVQLGFFFFFFITLGLEMSDTKVYEP